jgi:hypothetical protein
MVIEDGEQTVAVFGCGARFSAEMKLKRIHKYADCYKPSSNWAHGGPIIERERIMILSYVNNDEYAWDESGNNAILTVPPRWWASLAGQGDYNGLDGWVEVRPNDDDTGVGPTPLIAAMRAYVSSVYGDEVPTHPAQEQEEG